MTYTNEQINAALNKALDLKGQDYVYKQNDGSCDYAVAGEPSCLVGHVLHTLDPEMFKRVAEWERDPSSGDLTFDCVWSDLELPFDREQVKALRLAQVAQDQGKNWGVAAVEYAQELGEVL